MKKFWINYTYYYKINKKNKIILEYKVFDNEEDSFSGVDHFPYIELGFEDPYALLSSDWTIVSYKGEIIK